MPRPKGSKNKPKVPAVSSVMYDEDDDLCESLISTDDDDDIDIPGEVGIARIDTHNWALVETYVVPPLNRKTGKPNADAGVTKERIIGYYGNNLRLACLSALSKCPTKTHGAKEILAQLGKIEKRIVEVIEKTKHGK